MYQGDALGFYKSDLQSGRHSQQNFLKFFDVGHPLSFFKFYNFLLHKIFNYIPHTELLTVLKFVNKRLLHCYYRYILNYNTILFSNFLPNYIYKQLNKSFSNTHQELFENVNKKDDIINSIKEQLHMTYKLVLPHHVCNSELLKEIDNNIDKDIFININDLSYKQRAIIKYDILVSNNFKYTKSTCYTTQKYVDYLEKTYHCNYNNYNETQDGIWITDDMIEIKDVIDFFNKECNKNKMCFIDYKKTEILKTFKCEISNIYILLVKKYQKLTIIF